MDNTIKTLFENLRDEDKDIQYEALMKLFYITIEKVNWAYEVWDQLVKDLITYALLIMFLFIFIV